MTDNIKSTPAALWREKGDADPFGSTYDCERAMLTLGQLTDDELANAVFLHDHRSFNVDAILRGEPSSIALLTAAKERIRWLSRALIKAQSTTQNEGEQSMQDACATLPDGYLIEVNLENGAGWVNLYHHGDQVGFDEDTDDGMTGRIRAATVEAIAASEKGDKA